MNLRNKFLARVLLTIAVTSLAACGGGGASSSAPPSGTSQPASLPRPLLPS